MTTTLRLAWLGLALSSVFGLSFGSVTSIAVNFVLRAQTSSSAIDFRVAAAVFGFVTCDQS